MNGMNGIRFTRNTPENTRSFGKIFGGKSNAVARVGRLVDRGQTREICEKQEKYFKGKVATFTIQSLIL